MIADLTAEQIRARREEILGVYQRAFSCSDARRDSFGAFLDEALRDYAGVRVLAALDAGDDEREPGRLLGFLYGYAYERGHWWPDQVGPALQAAGHGDWERDAFEVVELAVAPEAQGRGIGGALLAALLDGLAQRHVLLATDQDNPARQLYRRCGLVELVADFRYSPEGDPVVLLGGRTVG